MPGTRIAKTPTRGVRRVGRSDWTLAFLLAFAVGAVALLALVTSPVAALLGESAYAIPATLHGLSAMVHVIAATVTLYLGYLMYTGRLESYHDVRVLAWLNAFLGLVTVLFGNWIYIAYRAGAGPREFFLQNSPAVHEVFFEFKEFVALFTVPLSVAAAYVLSSRGDGLREDKPLRQAVAVLLALSWAFLMLAFGLGAAITRLRSV